MDNMDLRRYSLRLMYTRLHPNNSQPKQNNMILDTLVGYWHQENKCFPETAILREIHNKK
jgi:hypothetical protein